MKVTSGYGVEIKKQNTCIRKTMDVYHRSAAWLIPVLDESWKELSLIRDPLRQFNEAEHLVHSTRKNKARYPEFDSKFPKMPSYLRRSAVSIRSGPYKAA